MLGQEAGHRWLAFLEFRDHTGARSEALLGRDQAHWSFFIDSDASVMEGNDIEDLGGGAFRTIGAVQRYSLLDQYAMGLVAEHEVPPFFYVENPVNVAGGRDAESAPAIGCHLQRHPPRRADPGHRRHPRPAVPACRRGAAGPPPGVHLHRRRRPHRVRRADSQGRPHPPRLGDVLRRGDERPHAGGDDAALAVTAFPGAVSRAILGLHACSLRRGPLLPDGGAGRSVAVERHRPDARGEPQSGAAPAVDARRLDAIEPLVREAIGEKKLPGAVVLVGRGDRILYQKAIGNRAVSPATEPMTLDTIFDLASLTKVVATTTSVMMLVEEGKIRLTDRVATFIPGFERYGKGDITIRHL